MLRSHAEFNHPERHLFCIAPGIASFLLPCTDDKWDYLVLFDENVSTVIRFLQNGSLFDIMECQTSLDSSTSPGKLVIGNDVAQIAPIRVKRFYVPTLRIGIQDLATWMYDFLDDPNGYYSYYHDLEERRFEIQYAFEQIKKWLRNGCCSFIWDEEFYLDKDGNVEMS